MRQMMRIASCCPMSLFCSEFPCCSPALGGTLVSNLKRMGVDYVPLSLRRSARSKCREIAAGRLRRCHMLDPTPEDAGTLLQARCCAGCGLTVRT
jgi:hypothetical protein